MKIGINGDFLSESDPTGIHVLGKGLLKGLNSIDDENDYVIYTSCVPENLELELKSNFKICVIKPYPFFASLLWLHVQLLMRARKDNVDIMLFYDHRTFLLWKPCKTVSTMLDLGFIFYPESFQSLRRWKFKAITYGAAHRSDHLLAISEATKNDVMKYYNIPKDTISVISMGCDGFPAGDTDISRDTDVLASLGMEPGYLLHIGVFQPRKNIEGMLRAFKVFKQKEKGKTKLILAGKKGWLYDAIIDFIETDEVCRNYVVWLGYVDDEKKWVLYRNARSLIFPSFYEGFGIPVLESMACGTPVLYADCSSLPEVVGDAGLGFDPYNVEEMASVMGRITADDQLCASLQKKGLQKAKTFTWDATARAVLSVFKRLAP